MLQVKIAITCQPTVIHFFVIGKYTQWITKGI